MKHIRIEGGDNARGSTYEELSEIVEYLKSLNDNRKQNQKDA